MNIKYDLQTMKYMPMFENLTQAKLKSCFVDDLTQVIFVVQPGEIGKAIGQKGANVKRIELLLKRKIKLVEYSADLVTFVKNLINPIKAKEIKVEESIVQISPQDHKSRGILIGKNAQNLRNYEGIIKKYFPIEEVKIV